MPLSPYIRVKYNTIACLGRPAADFTASSTGQGCATAVTRLVHGHAKDGATATPGTP